MKLYTLKLTEDQCKKLMRHIPKGNDKLEFALIGQLYPERGYEQIVYTKAPAKKTTELKKLLNLSRESKQVKI